MPMYYKDNGVQKIVVAHSQTEASQQGLDEQLSLFPKPPAFSRGVADFWGNSNISKRISLLFPTFLTFEEALSEDEFIEGIRRWCRNSHHSMAI